MFSIFFRRIQRFLLPIKIILLLIALPNLVYIVINFPPSLSGIIIFALIFFITLATILSFFLSTNRYLLTALTITFLLFLRAVDLFSTLNLLLFCVFIVLLAFYLRKR
jgi:hypothetical protein